MDDREDRPRQLRFTRVFEAPRALVFRCMIEPKHLTHFWGPAGVSAPVEEIHVDPRPGGRFDTIMVNDADGSRYPTRAVYVEVSEPKRLVWDEEHSGMRVTVTFHEVDAERTEVHILQENVPEPMRGPEAEAGFLTSLDKFSDYMRRMTVTNFQSWVAPTYNGLADLLASAPVQTWDAPSLCEAWQVRHVVAHVTMPARLTPEQFGAEMAAAGGDFNVLSNKVATRDSKLPIAELLAQLRSSVLHAWQPPGGGAAGALSHAVIHSLDVTVALDRPEVAPPEAVIAVLNQLTESNGAMFGVDLSDVRLEADDTDWHWGNGEIVRADAGRLVALLSARTLPDGRALRHLQP